MLNEGYEYNGVIFRSTWEARVAELLDFNNIKWLFEPKRFQITKYVSYLPDFYIPKYHIFIEVKGRFRDEKDELQKINTFRRRYKLLLIGPAEYNYINRSPSNIKNLINEVL
jgi:hypothetical protein